MKYKSLTENKSVVEFIWENSEGWPVEFVSENVKELFGYTAEEFKNGYVAYSDCVHKDDLERLTKEVDENSNKKEVKGYTQIYRIVTKDDEVKTIEDKTTVDRDEEGKVTYYHGELRDIT